MPTATNVLGYIPNNLGPLTTPAALPATCADNRYTYVGLSTTDQIFPIGNLGCPTSVRSECIPSGSKAMSMENGRYSLNYYSPGYECPSGWTTAGVTASGGKAEGVFTTPLELPVFGPGQPVVLPVYAQNAAMLDKAETLVWCCPSGMTAFVDGQCYSWLGKPSDFPSATEQCYYEVTGALGATVTTFDESTWVSPPLVSFYSETATSKELKETPIRTDIPDADIVIIEAEVAIALYYKADDRKETSTGSGSISEGGDDVDDKDGDKDGDKESSANTVGLTVSGAVSFIPIAAAVASVFASMLLL